MTFSTAVLAPLLVAASAIAARAPEAEPPPAKLTGTVAYSEPATLPPDALLQVRLEEPRPEMQPRLIAASTAPAGPQFPVPFTLVYTAGDVSPKKRYLARATISAGGKTLFVTRTPYPVITKGAPTNLEIVVQRAGGPKSSPAH